MIGDVLKNLRKERRLTQQQVAEMLKVSQQTYAKYENGIVEPNIENIGILSHYFNVSVDYLLGHEERPLPSNAVTLGKIIRMPVIGSIAAGYDGQAVEDVIDDVEILEKALRGYPREDCFVLKVKGDSMFPSFLDRDLIAVHRQSSVDSGDIAIVLYNGDDATIKKVEYVQGEKWMRLVPKNPEYQEKLIEGPDLQDCYILGKVISLVLRSID